MYVNTHAVPGHGDPVAINTTMHRARGTLPGRNAKSVENLQQRATRAYLRSDPEVPNVLRPPFETHLGPVRHIAGPVAVSSCRARAQHPPRHYPTPPSHDHRASLAEHGLGEVRNSLKHLAILAKMRNTVWVFVRNSGEIRIITDFIKSSSRVSSMTI